MKKGISQMADIAFSLLLFTAFFIIIMLISGAAKMQVHATVEAANAKFICNNNLDAAMQIPVGADQVKDLLIKDYITEDYTAFSAEIKTLFDEAIGDGQWELIVLQPEVTDSLEIEGEFGEESGALPSSEESVKEEKTVLGGTLHKVGTQPKESSEMCSMLIPVPCDTSSAEDELEYENMLARCNLEVQLSLAYGK